MCDLRDYDTEPDEPVITLETIGAFLADVLVVAVPVAWLTRRLVFGVEPTEVDGAL